jgi:hypothetical protein
MTYDPFASWADPIERGMPMTAEELTRLPDDGRGYELVEGRLVRMSPVGGRHSYATLKLAAALLAFVESAQLGFVEGGVGDNLMRTFTALLISTVAQPSGAVIIFSFFTSVRAQPPSPPPRFGEGAGGRGRGQSGRHMV